MKKLDDIKKYVSLMEECDLVELAIEEKDFKIKLRKYEGVPSAQVQTRSIPAPAPQQAPEQKRDTPANIYVVRSPLVGTLYRAPSPGAPPFVKEGDKIDAGKVLCIIEAMKVMNEIKSPVGGVVRKIYTENAKIVEFDQPLFDIETA